MLAILTRKRLNEMNFLKSKIRSFPVKSFHQVSYIIVYNVLFVKCLNMQNNEPNTSRAQLVCVCVSTCANIV